MTTRDTILHRLRTNVRETYDRPDMSFDKTTSDDPVQAFMDATVNIAGTKVVVMQPGDDINALIHDAYPDAKVTASNVPGVRADLNPDTVGRAQDLDGTDVGIIRGTVACAENGCIWIPQTMKERAICFIAEYLVIIIDRADIVSNMHQAYSRIKMPDAGFGTFISGPSKTADIEQALVYGAQASRGVTIIIA